MRERLMRLLGRLPRPRRDLLPMQGDSRRAELDAQRPRSDAALQRSSAALAIVRELEERLAGDPLYPTYDRRHRQLVHAPHRRASDR
jgi:hypothetical protein